MSLESIPPVAARCPAIAVRLVGGHAQQHARQTGFGSALWEASQTVPGALRHIDPPDVRALYPGAEVVEVVVGEAEAPGDRRSRF